MMKYFGFYLPFTDGCVFYICYGMAYPYCLQQLRLAKWHAWNALSVFYQPLH